MITQKSMFIAAIGLAAVSASVFAFKNYGIELTETNLLVLIIVAVVSIAAVVLYKTKDVILFSTKKGKELKSSEDLSKLLGLDSVTLHEKHIVAKKANRISCHAFFKIISVPYSVEDLNRERQLFVVGNFVRILSTLNFPFEIIPRILPVSPSVYLNQLHKEINDLRITLSAEGNIADSRREARLKHLEKLANRLQDGESVRDVSFLIHIMVDGNSEETIERELETNAKTLAAALESGLNVNAVRLTRHEMQGSIRDFFRVTMTISPRKSFRMMVWSLSFLIPLAKPKLPPLRKLLSGVYLGRTYSGAIVSIDLESYVNPHLVCLGTSGGGKSTSVKSLISRRHDLFETSIAILDYAGEYESWVSSRGGTIIDMSKKTINPFDLGPATLADRIRQLTDMFEKICEFETINQRFAFAHYLNLAYASKGFKINDSSTWNTETPTLENVTQLMEDDIPNLPMQRQAIVISLLSRVKELASGPFGIFGKSDVSIDSLMQGFVCIKLSTISNNALKDAISYTILQFIDSKMRLQGMQKQIKFILVLDEAWKIAKDPKSLPVTLIKEGRKYGYSLIVASQDATDDLAPQILSNAGTVIIHRLSYPKYLKYLKEAYNLIDVEIERIRDLAVGHAYVKIGNDPRGFFVKVDMEEVDSKQEMQIIEKPIAPIIGKTTSTAIPEPKEKILPIMPNLGKIRAPSDSLGAEQLYGKLSPKARKLLKAIAKNPELATTEYYKMLGLNSYQGNKAKSELEKHYFIDGVELPKITGKGRRGRVLRLTKTGYGVVNQSQSSYRFGGTIHRYLVNLIAKKFYEHKIEYEYPIGEGRRVDIVIDGSIAVEVERRDYSESNITKCLQADFEKVIVVCQTSKQAERFKGLLSEKLAADTRLTITDISSFLKEEGT